MVMVIAMIIIIITVLPTSSALSHEDDDSNGEDILRANLCVAFLANDSDGDDGRHANLCVAYLTHDDDVMIMVMTMIVITPIAYLAHHHHLLPAGARELALVALRLAETQLLSEKGRTG